MCFHGLTLCWSLATVWTSKLKVSPLFVFWTFSQVYSWRYFLHSWFQLPTTPFYSLACFTDYLHGPSMFPGGQMRTIALLGMSTLKGLSTIVKSFISKTIDISDRIRGWLCGDGPVGNGSSAKRRRDKYQAEVSGGKRCCATSDPMEFQMALHLISSCIHGHQRVEIWWRYP